MCGRFTSVSTPEDLGAFFEVQDVRADPLPSRYNVAPTTEVYAVALARLHPSEGGDPPDPGTRQRVLGAFRWGLVPHWSGEPSAGGRMINARAEGITSRPAYRGAIARRRCLVAADAYYEWQRRVGADGKAAGKLPHAIMRRDGRPMAFGGIWEVWRPKHDPEAPLLRTCAIVTTQANSLTSPIHDRMPLVLGREDWSAWLDPATDMAEVVKMMVPSPSEWLCAYPVGSRVNNVANDGPDLLDPLPDPAAGTLS